MAQDMDRRRPFIGDHRDGDAGRDHGRAWISGDPNLRSELARRGCGKDADGKRESCYSLEPENDHSHCDEKLGPAEPSGVSVPEHARRLSAEDLRGGSKHQSSRELAAASQGREEGCGRNYSRPSWFYRDSVIAGRANGKRGPELRGQGE